MIAAQAHGGAILQNCVSTYFNVQQLLRPPIFANRKIDSDNMFDMFKMLGKLNDVKAEASKIKEELKDIELMGKDSKDIVTVIASADKNVKSVEIDASMLLPEKKDEVDAAVLEATQNALSAAAEKAKEMIKIRINDKFPELAGMGLDKWLA